MEPSAFFSIGVKGRGQPLRKRTKPVNTKRKHKKSGGNESINFQLYDGPRWFLPKGMNIPYSVAYKFSLLEHIFNFNIIKYEISNRLDDSIFRFHNYYGKVYYGGVISIEGNGIELRKRTQIEKQYISRQSNEWNRVKQIYAKLFRFRRYLNSLCFRWKIRKATRNQKNTEDPVTLEIPKNPVTVLDISKKLSFVFEASAIRKVIENRLLMSDYMFAEPADPVNPLTNHPFTTGQMYSIAKQCREYGQYSWILDKFVKASCNIKTFKIFNDQALRIEAISSYFSKSRSYIRETVIDYFCAEADECEMSDRASSYFINAYDDGIKNPIIQKWINMMRDYYIAGELKNQQYMLEVLQRRDILLNRINHYFK